MKKNNLIGKILKSKGLNAQIAATFTIINDFQISNGEAQLMTPGQAHDLKNKESVEASVFNDWIETDHQLGIMRGTFEHLVTKYSLASLELACMLDTHSKDIEQGSEDISLKNEERRGILRSILSFKEVFEEASEVMAIPNYATFADEGLEEIENIERQIAKKLDYLLEQSEESSWLNNCRLGQVGTKDVSKSEHVPPINETYFEGIISELRTLKV